MKKQVTSFMSLPCVYCKHYKECVLQQKQRDVMDELIRAKLMIEEDFSLQLNCINYTLLEKENAELKEDLQTAISANQQWLKRDTRLEEQIEKMKCCGNCKHSFSNDIGCMQRARNKHCDNLKLWEPVE